MIQEVISARTEAIDNAKFVGMLEGVFKTMHEADFEAIPKYYEVFMHTALQIWKRSKFYNTHPRLIVLLNVVGNKIIEKACEFTSGAAIFELIDLNEASIAVNNLKVVLRVCSEFKSVFFDFKSKSLVQCPQNAWLIPNNALFMVRRKKNLSLLEIF